LPISRLLRLDEEFDRLFHPLGADGSAEISPSWMPAMDFYLSDDTLTLRAQLPGLRKEEIQVSLKENVLSISGKRQSRSSISESDGGKASNFVEQKFERQFTLPVGVDGSKVVAKYENGILNVSFPKVEAVKPIQIAVESH
jgi:HSP20 family protein